MHNGVQIDWSKHNYSSADDREDVCYCSRVLARSYSITTACKIDDCYLLEMLMLRCLLARSLVDPSREQICILVHLYMHVQARV